MCPYCKDKDLDVSETVTIPDPETGGFKTYIYYTCLNPRCDHYQKIINGAKEGQQSSILTVEQAKVKEAEDREKAIAAKEKESQEVIQSV